MSWTHLKKFQKQNKDREKTMWKKCEEIDDSTCKWALMFWLFFRTNTALFSFSIVVFFSWLFLLSSLLTSIKSMWRMQYNIFIAHTFLNRCAVLYIHHFYSNNFILFYFFVVVFYSSCFRLLFATNSFYFALNSCLNNTVKSLQYAIRNRQIKTCFVKRKVFFFISREIFLNSSSFCRRR